MLSIRRLLFILYCLNLAWILSRGEFSTTGIQFNQSIYLSIMFSLSYFIHSHVRLSCVCAGRTSILFDIQSIRTHLKFLCNFLVCLATRELFTITPRKSFTLCSLTSLLPPLPLPLSLSPPLPPHSTNPFQSQTTTSANNKHWRTICLKCILFCFLFASFQIGNAFQISAINWPTDHSHDANQSISIQSVQIW